MSDDPGAKEATPASVTQALQTEAGASAGGASPEAELPTPARERGQYLRKIFRLVGAVLTLRMISKRQSLEQVSEQSGVPLTLLQETQPAAPAAESPVPTATAPDKVAA
ncbi:MAG TPA: hypothetical protein VLF93_00710 [Candidatus Saccharimonadales bacterium]|nr:hypothetical protein [Candidatus Saccharimonadales bacterium]